ncbi:MAG: DHA2 family efflux MFS transporter permease subunit [Archangium sp.]
MTVATLEAAPAETTQPADRRRWLILFTILAAEVMDLLDGTIVNVAGPSIRESLGASMSALQWVMGGYALAFAIGLVTGGRLGDIYGRKRLFLIGVAGFTISSAACGLASSPAQLIIFRLVQGVFAASMIPQGFGIVREVFPPNELGKAFGLFGPVIGGSAILGPVLGGILVDADLFGAGWRTIFLVNVPLGIAAFIASARLFPESKASNAPTLDVVGAVLVSGVAGLSIYALIEGPEADWPWWTFAMLAASAVLLVAFVFWERARERSGASPLVPMRLFRTREFSAGLVSVITFFSGLVGVTFILGLFLQVGQHFSAIKTGLVMIPWALGTAIGAGVSAGALAPRFGRKVLHGGILVLMAGVGGLLLVALNAPADSLPVSWLIVPELLCGLGMGAVISPLFNFILSGVKSDEVGSASGVLNAVQQLGGATGIATIGTIFFAAIRVSGFRVAFERAMYVEFVLLFACLLTMSLLPAKLRADQAH